MNIEKRAPLVTFEGVDGSGKTTQIELLKQRVLEELGYERVFVYREPGGTNLGEEVRKLLKNNDFEMSGNVELHLFLAARQHLLETYVFNNINKGQPVIYDRFYDSTTVYQGHAGNKDPQEIREINETILPRNMIDATYLIRINADTSIERREGRGKEEDRIEGKGTQYLRQVIEGYDIEAKHYSNTFEVIDGDKSEDKVHEDIWNHFLTINEKYV